MTWSSAEALVKLSSWAMVRKYFNVRNSINVVPGEFYVIRLCFIKIYCVYGFKFGRVRRRFRREVFRGTYRRRRFVRRGIRLLIVRGRARERRLRTRRRIGRGRWR